MKRQRRPSILWYFLAAVLLALAFSPKPARSEEVRTYITVLCRSYHFDRDKVHNEQNQCLGLERDLTPTVRAVGLLFEDSNFNSNQFFGVNYSPFQWGQREWRLGLTAGVFTEYNPQLTPAAIPTLSYERKHWGIDTVWVPGVMVGAKFKLGF